MVTQEIDQKIQSSQTASHWNEIGIKHHHGVNVPLFSLHSNNSCGIGEFPDLIPLIDWCQEIGFDVIQLLPINDTGLDTSPYNALSGNALNPLFIGFTSLPNVENHSHLQAWITELQKLKSTYVDYAKVRETKNLFLQEYYRLEGKGITSSKEFNEFVNQNSWLKIYALFKTLKEEQHWSHWETWDESLKNPTKEGFEKLSEKYSEKILYHTFLQYLAFQQMIVCKNHATGKKVFIKGDIPILISPDSADVWYYRSLFHLDYTAGSLPDAFNEEGQNWGFPIYNWEEMKTDNFAWWVTRLKTATRLYHLYRIDHIVGFFRIWAIPRGLTGKHGNFWPTDRDLWIPQGKDNLKVMLEASPMLPIGEDLGTVPPEIKQCLREMGICGTKVMRWEKMWDEDKRFINYDEYIPESMTTVSTHDSQTLEQWWHQNPDEAHPYASFKGWNYSDKLSWQQRYEILYDSHHTSSLFHINLLQEYLALFPGMVSENLNEERINIPGVISEQNWTYRFIPKVEELVANQALKKLMRSLSG